MGKRMMIWMLAMLALAGTAWAQDNLERDPGYLDLRAVEGWFDRDPKLVVNIKGALLDLVAEASRYDDPDLANLLRKLKAIQVRGFSLGWGDYREVERRTDELARRLEAEGWDTVVRVRDDNEWVDVQVRVDDGAIAGMVVMVVSPNQDESFFVNIVGEIDPEQIGRIGRKFNIEPLDDMTVDF